MIRNWFREIWDAKWYLIRIGLFLIPPIAFIIILLAGAKFALRYIFGG